MFSSCAAQDRIYPMRRKYTLLALALMSFGAAAAFAQSSAEFGRASGGQLDLAIKAPSQFSGSLGLRIGRGDGLSGYGGTFGGTLVKDRMWFFAAAEHNQARLPSTVISIPNLGDRNNLASFHAQSNAFLSLRYTGIVSSSTFVTATASQTSGPAH
jgi:hypothetical protein